MDEQGRSTRLKDDAPMLPSDLDRLTPTQRLILEQAYVMAQELEAAADSAPEGRVIDRCESFLLGNGRDFLRKVLESTLQNRTEVLEKKGGRPNLPVRDVGTPQRQRDQNGDDRAGSDRSLAYLFFMQFLWSGRLHGGSCSRLGGFPHATGDTLDLSAWGPEFLRRHGAIAERVLWLDHQ
jgi:hypothetical protein